MNAALILAGGTGSRLGSEIPKQYIEINGRPIIDWSIRTFSDNAHIDKVWIVADYEWRDYIRNNTNCDKFEDFVTPGQTRQLSIWNGLEAIKNYCEISGVDKSGVTVLVHDAARPLLDHSTIDSIYENMKLYDGVMPVLPMKDTVYLSKDGLSIDSLLKRKQIYAGQAPECFDFNKYYEANKVLFPDKIRMINGSTEPAVMHGMNIGMIPGQETNFKITTKEDMERFVRIVSQG